MNTRFYLDIEVNILTVPGFTIDLSKIEAKSITACTKESPCKILSDDQIPQNVIQINGRTNSGEIIKVL